MRLELRRDIPRQEPVLSAVFILAALGTVGLARWFPFHRVPPSCVFKNATGHPCPSCGMTRSWVHLAHAHLADAVVQNPLGSVLFVLSLGAALYLALRATTALPALRLRLGRRESLALRWGIAAAIAANWAYVWWSGVA